MTTNHKDDGELSRLMQVCEAATPGPWSRNIPPASHYPTIFACRNTHVLHLTATNKEVEANAEFVTIFHPATVKSLLDELAALRKENEGLRVDADTVRSAMNELIDNWRELSDAAYRDGYMGRREIWADAARTLWTRLAAIDAARAAIGDSHE
jgi:hypothetical protein